ncbi:hypothetical protein N665_1109s0002 [Sinapis alba]|nr:hypothetical protein N665_1109s0002 [Sinapis alba]
MKYVHYLYSTNRLLFNVFFSFMPKTHRAIGLENIQIELILHLSVKITLHDDIGGVGKFLDETVCLPN